MNPISSTSRYSPLPRLEANTQREGQLTVSGHPITHSRETDQLYRLAVAELQKVLGFNKAGGLLTHAESEVETALNFYVPFDQAELYVSFRKLLNGSKGPKVNTIASMPISMIGPYVQARPNLDDLYKPPCVLL